MLVPTVNVPAGSLKSLAGMPSSTIQKLENGSTPPPSNATVKESLLVPGETEQVMLFEKLTRPPYTSVGQSMLAKSVANRGVLVLKVAENDVITLPVLLTASKQPEAPFGQLNVFVLGL